LRPPDFAIDLAELESTFSSKTRAIVVNNPHNPTGRVFSADELGAIAALCQEYDAFVISDEVYEEMTYGRAHLRIAGLPGMWERTLTLSSLGKTFSLTGWKVGWGIGPQHLTAGLRAAHQFLTFTTPTPVQHGAVAALGASDAFFDELRESYGRKRDLLAAGLGRVGFDVYLPEGTYFMMAGHAGFGFSDDRAFCRHLAEAAKVVAIPPGVFYHRPQDGSSLVRFAFCKDEVTLGEALERMEGLRP
jgi:aspartate/methionine/tyrosine aminotransferase